jgi:hypothetical protein
MLPGHSVSTLYTLKNYQILSFEEGLHCKLQANHAHPSHIGRLADGQLESGWLHEELCSSGTARYKL